MPNAAPLTPAVDASWMHLFLWTWSIPSGAAIVRPCTCRGVSTAVGDCDRDETLPSALAGRTAKIESRARRGSAGHSLSTPGIAP